MTIQRDDGSRMIEIGKRAMLAVGLGWLVLAGTFNGRLSAQSIDPRELFPQMQDSDWRDLAIGQIARQGDVIADLLDQLDNIPESAWQSMAQPVVDLSVVLTVPEEFAGQAFQFDGRVQESSLVGGNQGSDSAVWFTRIKDAEGQQFGVLSRAVPNAWHDHNAAGQPVAGQGLFIGARNGSPVLIVGRLRWFPDKPDQALAVGTGLLQLSAAGFDAGLLDHLRNNTDVAFTQTEYESFVNVMQAVSRIDENSTGPSTGQAPQLKLELLQQPSKNIGELFQIAGELRRITPVQVQQESIREAIGGNEYYQLDVFIPLGNLQVLLDDEQTGSDPLKLTGSYGVTVLMTRLPDELQSARLPQRIRVPGFFLKTWEHKTIATREASPDMRRPNPIFAGLPGQLQLVQAPETGGLISLLIPAFWGGLVALLVGLFFWSRSRGPSWHDRQRQQEAMDLDKSLDSPE